MKVALASAMLIFSAAEAQETAAREPTPPAAPVQQESPAAEDVKPAAAASASKPDAASSTKPKAASAEAPNDLVCRRERETGSHMSTEVCRTRAEVEAQQKDVADMKRQTLEKGNRVNPGG